MTKAKASPRPKVFPLWYEFHCPANDCMGAGSIFRVYGAWIDDDLVIGHGMPVQGAQAEAALSKSVRCPFCHEVAILQGQYRYNKLEPILVGGM